MINPTEIFTILQVNGLNKTSSLDTVITFLNQMKYSDEEKAQVIEMLKNQDWKLPNTTVEAPSVVQNSIPDVTPAASNTFIPQAEVAVVPSAEPVSVPDPVVTSVIPPVVDWVPTSTPDPAPVPAPEPYTPTYNQPTPTAFSQKANGKGIIYLIIILIIILFAGVVAYAYVQKIGPFSSSKYTEDNFSSSLLGKIAKIDTATYAFSGAINIVPRDAGAAPFTLQVSNSQELKKQYYYDSQRINDVTSIIRNINSDAGYFRGSSNNSFVKKYPNGLGSIATDAKKSNSYSNFSVNDPETGVQYQYQAINGGTDFNLTVTFSTDDAIKEIKRQIGKATSTAIDGNKVTFNKDGYNYFYLDQEPPKPFLSSISDSLQMLPPEVNAKIALTASSDLKSQNSAEWSFNLDAEGSFGDMTYKINADALRKDANYYLRINNIPSFFLFNQLATIKGKWVVIPSKSASSSTSTDSMGMDSSPLSFMQDNIPKQEAELKKNREKFSKLIQKIVKIADEEKIIMFKSSPKSEKVDGRNLIRYDISIRKDKILSFYTKIQDAINSDPELADFSKSIDQGYINYLKSDEFSQVFDYFDKNNTLTLWTDTDGYPAILQNVMRVVPPDSATQLKDNQINLTFKLNISNINKPIDIKIPENAMTLDKISSDMQDNGVGGVNSLDGTAVQKGKAAKVEASLSNMRAQAELYYSKNNSYGKKTFALGPCSAKAGTLFADADMSKLINLATDNNPSLAMCSSNATPDASSWAVSAPLPGDDGFSWCVDSTGASKRIINSLKGGSCNE